MKLHNVRALEEEDVIYGGSTEGVCARLVGPVGPAASLKAAVASILPSAVLQMTMNIPPLRLYFCLPGPEELVDRISLITII
ncbi:hypothetical protein EYF80_022050 [Liparis tanakae]|uniref:Uncharacterized protein n=1 Tax=Liparis tanakae TaxID=230148 RepID=A0A4Z2HRV7_9TELE|nr:hypothetical protein EYF80_022050 [Liparis tanakae]